MTYAIQLPDLGDGPRYLSKDEDGDPCDTYDLDTAFTTTRLDVAMTWAIDCAGWVVEVKKVVDRR